MEDRALTPREEVERDLRYAACEKAIDIGAPVWLSWDTLIQSQGEVGFIGGALYFKYAGVSSLLTNISPLDIVFRGSVETKIAEDLELAMLEGMIQGGPKESTATDPKSSYYDAGGIEVLRILKAKLTPEQFEGWLLGNIIKYSTRANFKDQFDRDIEKINIYSDILKELE